MENFGTKKQWTNSTNTKKAKPEKRINKKAKQCDFGRREKSKIALSFCYKSNLEHTYTWKDK